MLTTTNATPNGMQCRQEDIAAGFLYTYSYCAATDVCLADAWNYIDNKCSSVWIRGKDMDLIRDCSPTVYTCPSFTSSSSAQGQYTNYTQILPIGTYCTVTVDASQALARVIFDDTTQLGTTMADYVIGTPLTVKSGVSTYTIYNGDASGQITFIISFSSAVVQATCSLLLLATTAATFLALA